MLHADASPGKIDMGERQDGRIETGKHTPSVVL